MANLETLTIEISADAGAATQGITDLTTKIGGLGQAISNQMPSLKEFASTLKDIRSSATGGNIWKNITPPVSDVKKATTAVSEMNKTWAQTNKVVADATGTFSGWSKGVTKQFDPATGGFTKVVQNNQPKLRDYRVGAAVALGYKDPLTSNPERTKQIMKESEAFKELTQSTNAGADSIAKYNKEMNDTAKVTDKAEKSTNELAESTKEIAKASVQVKQTHTATKGLLSQIGRIAKTMLIRTAIRALMKLAKQGLQNYYQYSKSISGAFYNAVKTIQVNAATTGNQIGAMLGSLLNAIAPILNTILTMVSAVAEAITMLFSLFGGSSTYSKATNGLNSIGKAAGGAGGKMKELLADFDELNVIAQESGGGGGGSSGAFGFEFQEMQLPQWMIEWKPLIEALFAGTLGAIILPKIWEWVKKIFGLGTGSGATTIKDILEKLFGGGKNKDFNLNIKGLAATAAEAAALAASLKLAEEEIDKLNKKKLNIEGLSGAATSMGILAAAAALAAPAIEKIVAAIEGMNAGNGIMGILGTLITSLLSGLLGKTKVKVDTKEFDEFKKDFDEWSKQNKTMTIGFSINRWDVDELNTTMFAINHWCDEPGVKKIMVGFVEKQLKTFNFTARGISDWYNQDGVKGIIVGFLEKQLKFFNKVARQISDWYNSTGTKRIIVGFLENELKYFNMVARQISDWYNQEGNKSIIVAFDSTALAMYYSIKSFIDIWVNNKPTKVIGIRFDTMQYAVYMATVESIDLWASVVPQKSIVVSFNATALATYTLTTIAIDLWANAVLTKNIKIAIDTTAYLLTVAAVALWVAATPKKTISVSMDMSSYNSRVAEITEWITKETYKIIHLGFSSADYVNFWAIADSIDAWAKQGLTKTVTVNVVTTTTNKSSGNGTNNNKTKSTSLWDEFKTGVVNFVNNPVGQTVDAFTQLFKDLGFASGGFPKTGDLFIANEAGAEMIGSLNGRTAVANQQQIVDGIASGVERANSEQNTLLRQQNELLRGILQKEGSVRLGASAALGRTVQQSLTMYGNLTGG